MRVPDATIQSLVERGLRATRAFDHDHAAFPDGVIVYNPSSAGGNSLPPEQGDGGSDSWGVMHSPPMYLHRGSEYWFVTVAECMPGPRPGDFRNRHDSEEAAVADILDFYFGDPARMQRSHS